MRHLTFVDRLIDQFDQGLRTSFAQPQGRQASPGESAPETRLGDAQRQHAAGLMRINHVGEVCAQALYNGQAFVTRDPALRHHLQQAADEELDHLAWCDQRLKELDSSPSLLNPFWYAASWTFGTTAGFAGDRWSLGFVTETERQVESHLHDHLRDLPINDHRSRAIVEQMAEDEARHGAQALQAGGEPLPLPIRKLMTLTAKVMKFLAYRI